MMYYGPNESQPQEPVKTPKYDDKTRAVATRRIAELLNKLETVRALDDKELSELGLVREILEARI